MKNKLFGVFKLLFLALVTVFYSTAKPSGGVYNVFGFGAKGDGKTLGTT